MFNAIESFCLFGSGLPTVPHFGVQYLILPFGTPENAVLLGYIFCTPFWILSLWCDKLAF